MKKSDVLDNFYESYEELEYATIRVGMDNFVISVENTSEDMAVHVKPDNGPYTVLSPGTKVSFGSLKFTRDQLKLVYRSHPPLNYEDDGYEGESV